MSLPPVHGSPGSYDCRANKLLHEQPVACNRDRLLLLPLVQKQLRLRSKAGKARTPSVSECLTPSLPPTSLTGSLTSLGLQAPAWVILYWTAQLCQWYFSTKLCLLTASSYSSKIVNGPPTSNSLSSSTGTRISKRRFGGNVCRDHPWSTGNRQFFRNGGGKSYKCRLRH